MKLDIAAFERLLGEKGLTKSECAARAGLSRQSMSVILARGTCQPKTAGKLAVGLGVGIEQIATSNGETGVL